MAKIRAFDESTIETLKHMLSFGHNKRDVIFAATKKTQINDDFMIEFGDMIDSEIFSSSFMLSNRMIDRYPGLFDINIWSESDQKDPMIIFEETFSYKENITAAIMENIIKLIDKPLTKEQFDMYCDIFDSSNDDCFKKLFYLAATNMSDDDILNCISKYPIDTIATRRYLKENISKEKVEAVIDSAKDMCFSKALSLAMLTNDFAYIREFLNSDREYANSDSFVYYDFWKNRVVSDLPEDLLAKAISIADEKEQNVISYEFLSKVLQLKDFDEEDAMILINPCKRTNLLKALCDYGKLRDYDGLVLACVMQ